MCIVILQIKCYQYWPCGQAYGHVDQLEFGNFRIHYLQELHNEYFTIRTLELENMLVSRIKNSLDIVTAQPDVEIQ